MSFGGPAARPGRIQHFMIGEEVKDGSIICALAETSSFLASYLFTELGSKWFDFINVGLPF